MRKVLSTLLLTSCTLFVFCQQDTLLKKFKYRINNYRGISYGINGSGTYERIQPVAGTRTNSSVYAAVAGTYYTIKSTDKILLTKSVSFSSSYNGATSNNKTDSSSSKFFGVTPFISILNKWFNKNKFTELGADVYSNLNLSKATGINYQGPLKNKQAGYSISLNTAIGTGRLENITDMQNALWLYKGLKDAKIISRALSGDELIELGQTITKGTNTRVLDSRIRTQYILKTADHYFQENQLVTKTDIDYFVHLNDILFFAFNLPRLSGTEKYVRFRPTFSGGSGDETQNNMIDKNEQRYNTQSFFLSAGTRTYKPVSLSSQQNYGASVKLGYTSKQITNRFLNSGIVITNDKVKSDLKLAGVNLFFEQAFYPNTRTVISLGLQSEGGYQDLNKLNNFYGSVNLSCSMSYFISYKTRLTGNLGMSYEKNVYYNDVVYYYSRPENFLLNASLGIEVNL